MGALERTHSAHTVHLHTHTHTLAYSTCVRGARITMVVDVVVVVDVVGGVAEVA